MIETAVITQNALKLLAFRLSLFSDAAQHLGLFSVSDRCTSGLGLGPKSLRISYHVSDYFVLYFVSARRFMPAWSILRSLMQYSGISVSSRSCFG